MESWVAPVMILFGAGVLVGALFVGLVAWWRWPKRMPRWVRDQRPVYGPAFWEIVKSSGAPSQGR